MKEDKYTRNLAKNQVYAIVYMRICEIKSTTSGKGILEGKLVKLVDSFLCKYNLFFISLLFVIIWSKHRKLAVCESMLQKIPPNITSEPFFRCAILARMPHHDKKGKNPNMKKKLLSRLTYEGFDPAAQT